jgi:hypothetical protein
MWWLLLLTFVGCLDSDEGPWPISGSSYRIGKSLAVENSDVDIVFYESEKACRNAKIDEELCRPRVDRATGDVAISLSLRDPESNVIVKLPVTSSAVELFHEGSTVPAADFSVEPMGAQRDGQLFVLLIDGSGSMFVGERGERPIDELSKALARKSVRRKFYPGDGVRTGVMLLRFNAGVPMGLDGGLPEVLDTERAYNAMITQNIKRQSSGYTHLYDAVEYGFGDLLETPVVKSWLKNNSANATVIALTDGFNNEQSNDTCGDNARRLQRTLSMIRKVREGDVRTLPTLLTVGLGQSLFPDFEVPTSKKVKPEVLCGSKQNERIDGGLEEEGIDNASLEWMAAVGGGESFVQSNSRELAKAFEEAAREKYSWYRVRYTVNPFHHRRPFGLRIKLRRYAQAESSVHFAPSPWFDGPSSDTTDEISAWRHTTMVALLLLSILFSLRFVGPTLFNIRRAIFRLLRR